MNRTGNGSGPAESADERKDRLLRAIIVGLVAAMAVLAAGGVLPWIVAGALTLVGAAALSFSPPRRRLRSAQSARPGGAKPVPRPRASAAILQPRRGRRPAGQS